MKKRILVCSDWHCGHQVGLCPPGYQVPINNQKQRKFADVRDEVWVFFSSILEKYRPFDIAILNGDLLEGKGTRSGGTELITSDRKLQCNIALEVIKYINAPVIRMVYGTASHTGTEEDWEDIICDEARAEGYNAKIGSHEWINVNGVVFDLKHKIGSSTIPHGRLTPLAREILWSQIWAMRKQQPKADVLIRSHDHYFEHCDHQGVLGFITPCLQGFGSKYGSRECSGTVDIGFLVFDIDDEGNIEWKKELVKGKTQIAKAELL